MSEFSDDAHYLRRLHRPWRGLCLLLQARGWMAVLSLPGLGCREDRSISGGYETPRTIRFMHLSILSHRQRPPFMASSGLLGLWQPERVVAGVSAGGDVSALESETAEASLERRWT